MNSRQSRCLQIKANRERDPESTTSRRSQAQLRPLFASDNDDFVIAPLHPVSSPFAARTSVEVKAKTKHIEL